MSVLAELKNRLEAACVEQERRERETREQEERELRRLVEEERREEEECARREQQRNATDVGGDGLMETEGTVGVTETAGESWEADIARLHTAAMAGSSKDGGVEYQATEEIGRASCRERVCSTV